MATHTNSHIVVWLSLLQLLYPILLLQVVKILPVLLPTTLHPFPCISKGPYPSLFAQPLATGIFIDLPNTNRGKVPSAFGHDWIKALEPIYNIVFKSSLSWLVIRLLTFIRGMMWDAVGIVT